jgi:hypothetical protein
MVKKNIVGIIMINFIAAAFLLGYQMGQSSSDGSKRAEKSDTAGSCGG